MWIFGKSSSTRDESAINTSKISSSEETHEIIDENAGERKEQIAGIKEHLEQEKEEGRLLTKLIDEDNSISSKNIKQETQDNAGEKYIDEDTKLIIPENLLYSSLFLGIIISKGEISLGNLCKVPNSKKSVLLTRLGQRCIQIKNGETRNSLLVHEHINILGSRDCLYDYLFAPRVVSMRELR